MRKYILALSLIPCAIGMMAQTAPADSTVPQLDEIVVEGKNITTTEYGFSILPTKQEKAHATDAYTLLRNMNLPMLTVRNNEVSRVGGGGVSYFINGVPASATDCEALRPSQVIRVEYFDDNPDPRFGGARNIINFVMKELDWGGYVRLAPKQVFGLTYGTYPLYVKHVKGSMSYDLSAGMTWMADKSAGSLTTDTYRGLDIPAAGITPADDIIRTLGSYTHSHSHKYYASLRIMNFQKNGRTLRTTFSFNRYTGGSDDVGTLNFAPGIFQGASTHSASHSRNLSLGWDAYAYLPLSNGFSLSLTPSFSWGHYNSLSNYLPEGLPSIINGSKDDAYNRDVTVNVTKNLGHNNSVQLMARSITTIYHTEYSGNISADSDPTQKLTKSENLLMFIYQQRLPAGIQLYIRPGISYTYSKTSTAAAINQWNPRMFMSVNYSPAQTDYLGLSAAWGNSTPQANTSNELMRQVNELLWMRGNPDLKNIKMSNITLGYTHIFSDAVSGSFQVGYEGLFDLTMPVYMPEGDKMVQTFFSTGRYQELSATLNVPIKLCGGHLYLTPTLQYLSRWQRGAVRANLTRLLPYIDVRGFFGQWSVSAYYYAPMKMLDTYYTKIPHQYGIEIGWQRGELAISASAANIFNTRKGTQSWLYTPYYSTVIQNYGRNGYGRTFSVSVSYTIGYGKPTERKNEVRQSSGPESSAM